MERQRCRLGEKLAGASEGTIRRSAPPSCRSIEGPREPLGCRFGRLRWVEKSGHSAG
jgi:hypothetical protein